MKNKYFPVILVLMVTFVLALFADETLFEDIGASGYIKGGSGVLFSPAATTGTSTNNALTQIHAGTTGLWNSASSAGFWRFGRLEISENATDVRLGDTNIFAAGGWSMSFPRTATDDLQLKVDSGGRFKLTHGLNDTIMMTTNFFRFMAGTNEWIKGTMGDNTLIINGRDGINANSLIVTNYGSWVNRSTMEASNFFSPFGPSVWTTGTNQTFLLNVNSGLGTATMQATNFFFTGLINAPTNSAAFAKSGTLFAINTLQTNNTGSRQFFNVSVSLIPAVADKAEARLFVFSPGATNLSSIASTPANADGATRIIPLTAFLGPGDIGVVSNFSGATGSAVITNFMKTSL